MIDILKDLIETEEDQRIVDEESALFDLEVELYDALQELSPHFMNSATVDVGDYLFVSSGSGKNGFYVKALINEVINIWSPEPYDKKFLTVWHTRVLTPNGPNEFIDQFSRATGEKNENGWDIDETISTREFLAVRKEQNLLLINQMPWVDWPIGHAAYIGSDGFITLEEARQEYGRYHKRHLKRRMKQYLRSVTCFVASTWSSGGYGKHPGFPPLSSWYRKVYV